MAKQKLTEDERAQHVAVLNAAQQNLAVVIDQIGSLGSKDYAKVSEMLEDAYAELKEALAKV